MLSRPSYKWLLAVPLVLQVYNRLEHQNDNPSAIPTRELGKLIYGKDSVFARSPTPQQVRHLANRKREKWYSLVWSYSSPPPSIGCRGSPVGPA